MREAPTRHAVLFELLRQQNLSQSTIARLDTVHTEADWQAKFLAKAVGTLRRQHKKLG